MSQLLVLTIDHKYPFQTPLIHPTPQTPIQVRQVLRVSPESKSTLMAKVNFIKNLRSRLLVKLETVFEEEGNIHLMFEFINKSIAQTL